VDIAFRDDYTLQSAHTINERVHGVILTSPHGFRVLVMGAHLSYIAGGGARQQEVSQAVEYAAQIQVLPYSSISSGVGQR